MEIYEVSYLLLDEGASVKEAVSSCGGEVISFEEPISIDLAYSMTKVVGTLRRKVTSAYFGWVKFELPAEKIAEVKKTLDGMESVLRYLIIKTVRENTLLHGKMKLK